MLSGCFVSKMCLNILTSTTMSNKNGSQSKIHMSLIARLAEDGTTATKSVLVLSSDC